MSSSHDMRGERRRRGDDDSDDELSHKRRRGGKGDFSSRKLEDIISMVYAKNSSSLESNLESAVVALEEDIESSTARITDIICECVYNMPDKITIFSTLVGLLNAKKFKFGDELICKLLADLHEMLRESNFFQALNLVVFLADLVNCRMISANSFADFLESFVEAAFDSDIPQVRSDWYVYATLHCLPWVGHELNEKCKEALDNMLEGIEKYLARRAKPYVKMLQVWSESPHEQEEYLDCLWAQISKLRDDLWVEKYISRHYVAFDGPLTDAVQHNLPEFTPPEHTASMVYPLPTVVFRIFDYADCPDEGPLLPGAHSIERFLVEEELLWIIEQFCGDRKECASMLLEFSKRSIVPLNYVILEVVFSQLFRLPDPPTRQLFFGSLLIEVCKMQSKSMPQVIAQSAELLYQRVDSMHPACVVRLVDWFTYHLSNFEYRWSWSDWAGSWLEMSELSPKRLFLSEVLEKCLRFAYYERVEGFVPESFKALLPPKPVICSDSDAEDEGSDVFSSKLNTALREKMPVFEMTELLRELCNGNEEMKIAVLKKFMTLLLQNSQRTFSHMFTAITRYHGSLKAFAENNEEAQMVILMTVHKLWKNCHQTLIVLAKKLMISGLVDAGTAVSWLFSDDVKPEFHRQWTWEILSFILEHVSGHVRRTQIAYAEYSERAAKRRQSEETSEGAEKGDEAMDEDVNAKQQEIEGLQEFQKNLLLDVLHKFTVLLTEHIVNSETENFQTDWYRLVVGRFRSVFLVQWSELFEIKEALDSELFKPNAIDPNVMEIYNQFISLRA